MNILHRLLLTLTLVTLPLSLITKAPAEPAQISQEEIEKMFGVSGEEAKQMAQMMSEFDAAIKKDPELQKMFNELEQQLEQEIEQGLKEGKTIEEILGVEAPPSTPVPAPAPAAAPAAKPAVVETARVEEKPVVQPKVVLRNRTQAEHIIQDLRNTIAKIQTKAATSRSVTESLQHLQPQLDLVMYYLHVINKPAHLDQLVSDPELTSLHDLLKELHHQLSVEEPLFVVPEMVGEELDKRTKARSKTALRTIKKDLEHALKKRQLIQQFEKLVKKYEPQALKLRAEAEATAERAKKEAEKKKSTRPTESRIKKEEEYARGISRGGGRFNDWYYGGDRQRGDYRGGNEGAGTSFGGAGREGAEAGKDKTTNKTGEGKEKGKEEAEKEAAEKGEQSPASKYYNRRPASSDKTNKKLEGLEDLFTQIDASLETRFGDRTLAQELANPTDAQFDTLKTTIEDLATELGKVQKLKISISADLRKLDVGRRGSYEGRMTAAIEQRRAQFLELYQAALALNPARQAQFNGNCPGANCLKYLMESIENLYRLAPQSRDLFGQPGRGPVPDAAAFDDLSNAQRDAVGRRLSNLAEHPEELDRLAQDRDAADEYGRGIAQGFFDDPVTVGLIGAAIGGAIVYFGPQIAQWVNQLLRGRPQAAQQQQAAQQAQQQPADNNNNNAAPQQQVGPQGPQPSAPILPNNN